ncbi:UDP-glucuronic acid decarboxylase family protein [Rubrobacter aplysinae]|uniref:UDP-glucuronic acid decarboxylase family protein n=1 Tax=Rubrobacter aplysinae TaxID=909625 RepID=UPI00064BC70C|nr:UDP-glucuronic acid decarboxylase family protein [Rubrobacter aplysinae]
MASAHGEPRRALVTGGAGFVGSHLCERLLSEGYSVVCLDDLSTGSVSNVGPLLMEKGFELVQADVTSPLEVSGDMDEVYHLASPASPADFESRAIQILRAGSEGTRHALELARDTGARFLLASTSEVYGDPLVHPQHEEYLGNVDPVGIRGVYDEAKRYAEALTTAYSRRYGVHTRIARIFNTYGPLMRPDDGRMVPNFFGQVLAGEPLTVYGDGGQTRSIQYVDDLVEGLVRLMRSGEPRPVNLGNPEEHTVKEIAQMILDLCGGAGGLVYRPLPEGDPVRRCPDIGRARGSLGWAPRVPAREGLERTLLSLGQPGS